MSALEFHKHQSVQKRQHVKLLDNWKFKGKAHFFQKWKLGKKCKYMNDSVLGSLIDIESSCYNKLLKRGAYSLLLATS